MKKKQTFYTYSELAIMGFHRLIDIFSDGDMPKKTREQAGVVLETKGFGFCSEK